jgi:hypothetical protein
VSRPDFPPSTHWAALKIRGEVIAEAWFQPGGDPNALIIRIPRDSFALPGIGHRLTAQSLLRGVGVAPEDVESWHLEGQPGPASPAQLGQPLSPPPQDATHASISFTLRPPSLACSDKNKGLQERWEALEARWNAILAIEASIDMLRIALESLRGEMEAAVSRQLSAEEKVNALGSDVAQWTKAKARLHSALPKARDFIHRSTWAAGTPERKRAEEVVSAYLKPRAPFDAIEEFAELLDSLLKDRQVLSSLGVSVQQECKAIKSAVDSALRSLQMNAAAKATRMRGKKR